MTEPQPKQCAHDCPCEAHGQGPREDAGGLKGLILPLLACALCPACLGSYAKLLATLGVGIVITEAHHTAVLAVAVVAAVGGSAWRTWRTGVARPLLVSLAGCALLVAGHALESEVAEWLGLGVLLVGGLTEHILARRAHRRPVAPRPALSP